MTYKSALQMSSEKDLWWCCLAEGVENTALAGQIGESKAQGGLGHLVACANIIALVQLTVVDIAGSEKQLTRAFTRKSVECTSTSRQATW